MAAKSAIAVKKPRELTEEEILKAPDKDYMNEARKNTRWSYARAIANESS